MVVKSGLKVSPVGEQHFTLSYRETKMMEIEPDCYDDY